MDEIKNDMQEIDNYPNILRTWGNLKKLEYKLEMYNLDKKDYRPFSLLSNLEAL